MKRPKGQKEIEEKSRKGYKGKVLMDFSNLSFYFVKEGFKGEL